MKDAFHSEFRSAECVVIIGTDSPTLPPRIVDEAFDRLSSPSGPNPRVVIGPACDGGYYLLGIRQDPTDRDSLDRTLLALFGDGIQWGTCAVLPTTIERLDVAGVHYRLLDFWYDIDRRSDIRMMLAHVGELERQGVPLPKRTLALLKARGENWKLHEG